MAHTHIGQEDWGCISRMLRAGHSLSEIARTINKDVSSFSRHVREYGGRDSYDAQEVRRRKRMKRIAAMESIRLIRGRIGDFEGDTLMGRDKRVRIVSFVDRRTGYLIAFLLTKMNAELLTHLALKKLRRVPKQKRKTVTLDNGVEFSDWELFEKRSGMIVYFAYPYHAWERGTNENTNGLLRQYFPKSYDFNLITPSELAFVVRRLNNRERKRLGFLSPRDVFWKK